MKLLIPTTVVSSVFLLCSISASAQIQMETKPYQVAKPYQEAIPAIQFAIGEEKPAVPVVVAPPAPALTLLKGKSLEAQFKAYAEKTGWTLIWNASNFVLDNDTTIQGDFETALTSFLTSANASGSRLRAAFYRGNNTVRVEEF